MFTPRQLLATTVIALAAGPALAADNGEAFMSRAETPAISTVSRAEVLAQVGKARAAGELLAAGEAGQATPAAPVSTLARAQVKAAVLAARANGELIAAGEVLRPEHRSIPARKLPASTTVAAKQ